MRSANASASANRSPAWTSAPVTASPTGFRLSVSRIHHRRNRYVVVQDYQGDAVTGEPPIPARHQIGRAARDPIASGAADNATRIAAATRSAVPAETAVPRWVRGRPALVRRRRWQPKWPSSSVTGSSVTGWPKGHRGVQRQRRIDVSNLHARRSACSQLCIRVVIR